MSGTQRLALATLEKLELFADEAATNAFTCDLLDAHVVSGGQ